METNVLGNKLRSVRKSKDLTLMLVYFSTGIHASTLSDWEMGRIIPTLKNLIKLAQFYGISIDWLAGLSSKKFLNIKTENEK